MSESSTIEYVQKLLINISGENAMPYPQLLILHVLQHLFIISH